MDSPRDLLSARCARPESEWDLAEAALLVAASEYRGLDVGGCVALLDELGLRGAAAVAGSSARERAAALARFLHEEEMFDGDRDDYGDPRNSYLNEVLERRKGLPILLCLVYCEVGRRAGVRLEGVGLPGHFIVRTASPRPSYLDPFHGGRLLSVQECAERVRESFGSEVKFSSRMLRPATPREFLTRLIRNLKRAYLEREDPRRAWRMADLLLCADPEAIEEVRDRGLLALQLKRYGAAAEDLARYLGARSGARDAGPVVEALRLARREMALLN